NLDIAQGTVHESFGGIAGFGGHEDTFFDVGTVLNGDVFFEGAVVDADSNGEVEFVRLINNRFDVFFGADVAGIDADVVHKRRRVQSQPMIEMDIGDQGDGDPFADLGESR